MVDDRSESQFEARDDRQDQIANDIWAAVYGLWMTQANSPETAAVKFDDNAILVTAAILCLIDAVNHRA